MEGKHTSGPWQVETTEQFLWVGTPKADSAKVSEVVVSLDYGKGYNREFYQRQEANARLIAAAPDLLEAAKLAEDIIDDFLGHLSPEEQTAGGEDPQAAAALKSLRAAIKKAGGE